MTAIPQSKASLGTSVQSSAVSACNSMNLLDIAVFYFVRAWARPAAAASTPWPVNPAVHPSANSVHFQRLSRRIRWRSPFLFCALYRRIATPFSSTGGFTTGVSSFFT